MILQDSVTGNPVNLGQMGTLQVKPVGEGAYRVIAVSTEGTDFGQFEVNSPMDGIAAQDLLHLMENMIGMTSLNVLYPS